MKLGIDKFKKNKLYLKTTFSKVTPSVWDTLLLPQ